MIDIIKIKENKTIKELLEFGIINIDKSSGPTSFSVSEFVKNALKLRKTSHFGTLDPKVTGVLPVALNRACKLTGFFLGEDKEYVGIMRMHEDISIEKIKKAVEEKFTGKIMQKPPVKSRVKRQEREREVKRFEILEKEGKAISLVASRDYENFSRVLEDRELRIENTPMPQIEKIELNLEHERREGFGGRRHAGYFGRGFRGRREGGYRRSNREPREHREYREPRVYREERSSDKGEDRERREFRSERKFGDREHREHESSGRRFHRPRQSRTRNFNRFRRY